MSNEVSMDLHKIRHSMSHIMAEAVIELFPDARFAIGPAIDNGFYYDFDLPRPLKQEELEEITGIMVRLIERETPFVKEVVSREEALGIFKDQPYKVELINQLEDQEISTYTQGGFRDLCKGPHVEDTRSLNSSAFKLLSIAGAYWRGDENQPMLQRIYGTAWRTPKELRAYLKHLEDVEKRDHRKLGRELDLFSLHEQAGAGLIYWHPKGARIRTLIEEFWRDEHYSNGYEMVATPHIGKAWLWETSGHLDFYKEGMYPSMEMDNAEYFPKPMNCPFHIMIYNTRKRSYRELPCRWAELGTVYRYEKSGVLHGLLRVRGFTQDDAHIICTPGQVEEEILRVLRFSLHMLRSFGFKEIQAFLATKPEKSVGDSSKWDTAIDALKRAVDEEGIPYEIDHGGGAFYGPKIDLKIKDAMGRGWQLSTVQFDFNLPERFNMRFVDSDGVEKQPFMVHRALLGSIERFFGVLIEHYGGAFPVWLAPVQARIIPVANPFNDYAIVVKERLGKMGIRVELDLGDDRMNAKIRDAQNMKIPYMVILGEREMEANGASVRLRTGKQHNQLSLEELGEMILQKIGSKESV